MKAPSGQSGAKPCATAVRESPLLTLAPADLAGERVKLESLIKRPATEEEFVMYMNHPADALKTIEFRRRFGDPNALPLDVWFEGLRSGETLNFSSSDGNPTRCTFCRLIR